jgi:signal transduction histidine kinase
MASKFKQSLGAYAIIAGLIILLVVLAVLQFRWSNQLRDADLERKKASLEAGVNGFREDFRRELAGVCTSFGFRSSEEATHIEDVYARQCGDWARSSDHRDLVANFYLWKKGKNETYTFLQYKPQQNDSFSQVDCPSRLGLLCNASDLEGALAPRGGDFAPMGFRWRVQGESLTMVRPIPQPGWRSREPQAGCPPDCPPAGFMIVELDHDALLKRFLPELTRRYFAGPEGELYDVAIVNGEQPPQFIYSSDPNAPPELATSPDESARLFVPRRPRGADGGEDFSRDPGGPRWRERMRPPRGSEPGRDGGERGRFFPGAPILADTSASEWRLVVRHPGTSMEQWAALCWRRDLLLGSGVLLVLAASMILVFVWIQRISRLAKMQMDFVASVSHELRTPVSVINSAAENLADGVVASSDQVKHYGALIRNEAQRLGGMIGQILLFATTRDGNEQVEPRPVVVGEVINSAVDELDHLIAASGFKVEKEVPGDLPQVMADPKALGRCLQSLITNVLKYASNGQWMGIRAQTGSGEDAGRVLITVEDRGPGIEADEVGRIFEPFYRGNAARASQTHGAGLGLSLAREAIEAMGGKLTAANRLGEGSIFTVHLSTAK